jgi:hypothetical protein
MHMRTRMHGTRMCRERAMVHTCMCMAHVHTHIGVRRVRTHVTSRMRKEMNREREIQYSYEE